MATLTAADGESAAQLFLLGGFSLVVRGARVTVPRNAQRLCAFLALRRGGATRGAITSTLWPDFPERRAAANLRSTLWRTARAWPGMLESRGDAVLRLGARVEVDIVRIEQQANLLCSTGSVSNEGTFDVTALQSDVLPDWHDDWIIGIREWFRQVRLHALDALCAHYRRSGMFHHALRAGIAAVATEPLRESAQRELVALHLAEGNPAEALRQYDMFRRMLEAELGVPPSPAITRLVAPLRRQCTRPVSGVHNGPG
jgi:DNA-binding SARP family transcriptional activator